MHVGQLPQFEQLTLINGTVTAGNLGMSEPLYVGNLEKKTIMVSANQDTLVYVLGGPDGDNCDYYLKSGTNVDTEDTDREWDCNDEKIMFQVNEVMSYISVVVDNEAASDATVRVDIVGG